MKNLILIFSLILPINLLGQTMQVSDKLTITKLTDKTYLHTCENSNGIVFINGEVALVVSTPDSDTETQNLIDWVQNEKHAKIVAYVIDRWHPDAMEGLDIVHKNGIKTYSYELTRQIAKDKGLPVPQIGFDPKTEIQVGSDKVICYFLGEAHTTDGIVVWIPSEQILFGGNEIRNYNGWVGNIGDASLDKWSETATRVKKEYGTAKIVIPGHGRYGGIELVDYTIALYKPCMQDSLKIKKDISLDKNFKTNEDFYISAETETIEDGNRILENAIVVVQDSTKYVKIESPLITYKPDENRIDSENGGLKIYDKTMHGEILRTDISYKRLTLFKKNDSVGLRIIIKEFNEQQ
nr:subclass B1 metallo-beta-lactamase, long type [uncultured Draconibacterium sp.]